MTTLSDRNLDRIHTAIIRAELAVAAEQIERGESVEWTPELMAEIDREARQAIAAGWRPDPSVTGDYPEAMLLAVDALIQAVAPEHPNPHAVMAIIDPERSQP